MSRILFFRGRQADTEKDTSPALPDSMSSGQELETRKLYKDTHQEADMNIITRILCILLAISMAHKALEAEQASSSEKTSAAVQPAQKGETAKSPSATRPAESKQAAHPSSGALKKAPAEEKAKAAPAKEKQKTETQKEKDEKLASRIDQTLDFGIQKDRKEAINHMQMIKDPDIRSRMEKRLAEVLRTDSDTEILVKALTVAGEMNLTSAADAIVPHIHNDSEDVRIAAVFALRDIKAEGKKDELIKKLKEQDTSVDSNFTEAMILTLGDFKASALNPWAQEQISNIKTSKIVRSALVLFLGKAGTPAEKDFLLKIYNDENEDLTIRAYAVNGIGKLGIKEASPDIRKMLSAIDSYPFKKKKSYYTLYLYSVAALVKMGDPEAVPRLMEAMKSNNTGVRIKAIDLIKEFNDKRTIDILQYKMKYDPEVRVRNAARKALKELGVEVKDAEKEGQEGDEEKKKKDDES